LFEPAPVAAEVDFEEDVLAVDGEQVDGADVDVAGAGEGQQRVGQCGR